MSNILLERCIKELETLSDDGMGGCRRSSRCMGPRSHSPACETGKLVAEIREEIEQPLKPAVTEGRIFVNIDRFVG